MVRFRNGIFFHDYYGIQKIKKATTFSSNDIASCDQESIIAASLDYSLFLAAFL